MLFPDHIPWSVTALARRPHKNVKPGRTVRAVEGLVGCPGAGRQPGPSGFSWSRPRRVAVEPGHLWRCWAGGGDLGTLTTSP